MNRTQHRIRISIAKENRILDLYNQGYGYDSIAAIVNCSPGSITAALKRIRNRWKYPNCRYFNRKRGFFSDREVEQIRDLYHKLNVASIEIAKQYEVSYQCIMGIVSYRTYAQDEKGYPFDFSYRPNRKVL